MAEVRRWQAAPRGNQAVDLLRDIRDEASNMINQAGNTNIATNIDPLPEFMKGEMYWIVSLFPKNRQVFARYREQIRIASANFAAIEGHDLGAEVEPKVLMKCFFKILKASGYEYLTTLMVVNSMLRILSPNFQAKMDTILDEASVKTMETSLIEFIIMYPVIAKANPLDIKEYAGMTPAHFSFGCSLLLTIIGKGLNSNNYSPWMLQRVRSFSLPLGLEPTDKICRHLKPSEAICVRFYQEVKMEWRVRRLYFEYIWGFSRRSDILGVGCRVTVNLLRNAELTNISMIFVWIGTLNNILMGWNELAKYVPYMCAAYAKYRAIGEMAPWCKLILNPAEVLEFNAEKLRVLFSVAKALSAKYGSPTAKQIEGASNNVVVDKIVTQALRIVAYSGGARTIDTMAVRLWRLGHYENAALIKELDTGALEVPVVAIQEDEANVEARLGGE